MNQVLRIFVPLSVVAGLLGLFWYLLAGKEIPVLQPSGEVATAQYELFVFTTALSLIIVIPVFTLLAVFAMKYRAGNTKAKYTPEWGENRILESLWWGIPICIIGVLSVVIVQTSHSLDPYKELSGGRPIEVQAVALRWKWLFFYPEYNVSTLNYIQIPVDRPIRFTLTGDAPMSAFWIPSLGSQVYAMNGMESQLNLKASTAGIYTGYTTNINGEGYAKMTFKTKVTAEDEFNTWTKQASITKNSMNLNEYTMLSEPESIQEERTYKLADDDLFDTIVNKFGHSHNRHESHKL